MYEITGIAELRFEVRTSSGDKATGRVTDTPEAGALWQMDDDPAAGGDPQADEWGTATSARRGEAFAALMDGVTELLARFNAGELG